MKTETVTIERKDLLAILQGLAFYQEDIFPLARLYVKTSYEGGKFVNQEDLKTFLEKTQAHAIKITEEGKLWDTYGSRSVERTIRFNN